MLTEIYIDNYKCLVNFTITLDRMALFLGANGAGKTTVIELLAKLQRFLAGDERVGAIFPTDTLTKWQTTPMQRVELKVSSDDGIYHYQLAVKHDPANRRCRVESERLTLNGKPLFEFEQGTAKLYRNDFSPGPEYPFDWSQSGLATLQKRSDNTLLTNFKEWMNGMIVVRPNPPAMGSESLREESFLSLDASNFASWYRYISQEHQAMVFELTNGLRETIDGFHSFKLSQAGEEARSLQVGFVQDEKDRNPVFYRFNELSDGQRLLILLYALLYFTRDKKFCLCMDEPENYLALPEIQPWLVSLYDACQEQGGQVLLISHHPEVIDYLAAGSGYWLEREANAPVRIKRIEETGEAGLAISELVARGWING